MKQKASSCGNENRSYSSCSPLQIFWTDTCPANAITRCIFLERVVGINESKDQEVLLLLLERKTLAPCLLYSNSPLPACNSCQVWNSWAAIKKYPGGWRDPVGRTVLLRPQLLPNWGREGSFNWEWRGGKKGRKIPFLLSLHLHVLLKPIVKARIIFSSISVVEGTMRTCSHLSRSVPLRVSHVTLSFQARDSSTASTGEQLIYCNKLA